MKISVVIRNKNQETALTFLLKNLVARYAEDVDEIVVVAGTAAGATSTSTSKPPLIREVQFLEVAEVV